MEPRPRPPTLSLIARIFLLLFLLLALGTPPAAASGSAQAASDNIYSLDISQSRDPICVGDAVNVTIQWGPNMSRFQQDDKNGLAPLTPLGGPSRIQLKASLGYFYPESPPPPGSNSGIETVTYIAEKTGQEKLFAVAWNGGSSDAIATIPFKVEACEYFYTLNGEFNLGVTSEGLSYTARYTIKSHGTLVAPDPDQPLHLEARDKVVKLGAVVTSWSSSKCTLFTYEPGTGMGYVDARADPGPHGLGMDLKIGPPKDLAWDVDLSFACDGNAQTVAFVYPLSEADPWISATFPEGGGQQTIKLDMFEVPFNKLNGAEGLSVSYTATLTLEKKPPK
jgi:hypothetical protein